MTMPKFDFSKMDITEEEYQVAKNATGGNYLEPGVYDVEVVKVELGKQNITDPTWYSVKITLEDGAGRSIRHTIMLPTRGAMFNKPGLKSPLILFVKFRALLAGLGIDVTVDTLKTVVPKYFSAFDETSPLLSKTTTITVGYNSKYHVKRTEDGLFKIYEKDGKEFVGDGTKDLTFPDRDGAVAEAAEYGIKLQLFPEVISFKTNESVVAVDSKVVEETTDWDE